MVSSPKRAVGLLFMKEILDGSGEATDGPVPGDPANAELQGLGDARHAEGDSLAVIATGETALVVINDTQVTAVAEREARSGAVGQDLLNKTGGAILTTEDRPAALVVPAGEQWLLIQLEEERLGQPSLSQLVGDVVFILT
ncbi:unnamed protein product [Aspergillus oryzae]|nr:unnamed protein product [Aspergillus oryzae]